MFTKEQVQHIANLSMLELDEKEASLYAEQFEQILHYFNKLNELDTSQTEELLKASPLKTRLRDDVVLPGLDKEEALGNAPERSGNLVKVPPVV